MNMFGLVLMFRCQTNGAVEETVEHFVVKLFIYLIDCGIDLNKVPLIPGSEA